MSCIRYAAYGSNLHPVRLTERLPSARLLGAGRLPAFSLSFEKRSLDGSGKCTISPGGGGVYVAVYEISLADKQQLDMIEGVGKGYACITVDVPGFNHCTTYIAEDSHRDPAARPYDWYRELVLLGCRYHGFPAEYIRHVGEVDADCDGNLERRADNHRLLMRMYDQ